MQYQQEEKKEEGVSSYASTPSFSTCSSTVNQLDAAAVPTDNNIPAPTFTSPSPSSTSKWQKKGNGSWASVSASPTVSEPVPVTSTFWPYRQIKSVHNNNSSSNSSSSSSTNNSDTADTDIRQRFERFVLNSKKNHNNNNSVRTTDKSRTTFWPQTNNIITHIAQDLPILRVRSISPDLISAQCYSIELEGLTPLQLSPKQKRLTRKEIQRFIKEVEHPLRYLGQSIPLQSAYDELQSMFLEVTPLPNDLISLIREYRLEVLSSQPVIISPKFGQNHPDSRPFNTAAIEISSQDNFDEREFLILDDDTFMQHWFFDWNHRPLDRCVLEGRMMRGFIPSEKSQTKAYLQSTAAHSLYRDPNNRPPIDIVHSLASLIYSGLTIRQIIGYSGTSSRNLGESCIGVNFVYGPQIDPPESHRPNRIPTCDLVERVCQNDGPDTCGFVMRLRFDLRNRRGWKEHGCRYSYMRLELDEYVTNITFRVCHGGFAIALIFHTNFDRQFAIGPGTGGCTPQSKLEYTITTPSGYALIALTGTEGGHMHSIRGVYAAIRRPTKQQSYQEIVQKEDNASNTSPA